MSSVNDQVSSELEKEGVASASTEESVSRDEPEARQEVAPSPEELLAALQNAEREKIELTEALARARADFFNYRKRVDRDRQKERSMIAERRRLIFCRSSTIWTARFQCPRTSTGRACFKVSPWSETVPRSSGIDGRRGCPVYRLCLLAGVPRSSSCGCD